MMRYLLPALLLTLLIVMGSVRADPETNNPETNSQSQLADVWSDRGGKGLNISCGHYRVGEEVTLYFQVSKVMYIELYIIRPDGSKIRLMNISMTGPGVVYKTPPILLIDEGPRTAQLVGARSHQVLDSCNFYVTKEVVGGDVWTDEGGRGRGTPGGTFPPLKPIRVALRINSTAEVELKAIISRGEQVLFKGKLEANEVRYVYLEALQEGVITLKLLHDGKELDTCRLLITLPVEENPPILEVNGISVSGLTVTVNGKVEPGTPNATVILRWMWGDGTEDEGEFPKSHTYSKGGKYTITVIAEQSDGLSSNFTYTVQVSSPETATEVKGDKGAMETSTSSRPRKPPAITRVITVTPERIGTSSSPYPALSFLLGSVVTVFSFLIISRLLRRQDTGKGMPGSGQGDTGAGED